MNSEYGDLMQLLREIEEQAIVWRDNGETTKLEIVTAQIREVWGDG